MYSFVSAFLHWILCLWFIHAIAYNSSSFSLLLFRCVDIYQFISSTLDEICVISIHLLLGREYNGSGHYFSVAGSFVNIFWYNLNHNTWTKWIINSIIWESHYMLEYWRNIEK